MGGTPRIPVHPGDSCPAGGGIGAVRSVPPRYGFRRRRARARGGRISGLGHPAPGVNAAACGGYTRRSAARAPSRAATANTAASRPSSAREAKDRA